MERERERERERESCGVTLNLNYTHFDLYDKIVYLYSIDVHLS